MARLGVSVKEFYKMTPAELQYALVDHMKAKDEEVITYYNGVRKICVAVWNSAGKTLKSPIEKESDFMPLPGEIPKAQTVEDMKSILMGLAGTHNIKVKKGKDG